MHDSVPDGPPDSLRKRTIGLLTNRLRLWRVDNGLTLEEISDLAGVSVAMISRVERGQRQLAPLTKVQFARRLGVPIRELFDVEPLDDGDPDRPGSDNAA
jgi:transcriptional regulator with XRE-family HTH domain